MTERINAAVQYIQKNYPATPAVGIILGTGLGALVNDVAVETVLPYSDIPHFPLATVESHSGKLIFGRLAGRRVMVMQGRFHYYEGYSLAEVTFPVRVMQRLGIGHLLISNAAGALNPAFGLGDLMAINDHLNLMPDNPLRGKNLDAFGPRFPDMAEPYHLPTLSLAAQLADQLGITLHQGVYAAVPGPNLETRAEYRMLRTLGADAVGMSTVPEVIVARHCGLPVFAVSVLTDLCTPSQLEVVTLEKVIAVAARAEPQMARLFCALVEALA
jgi:purine-nucleoside phosphorylase